MCRQMSLKTPKRKFPVRIYMTRHPQRPVIQQLSLTRQTDNSHEDGHLRCPNVALTHPTDDDYEVDDLKEMLLPLASGSFLP